MSRLVRELAPNEMDWINRFIRGEVSSDYDILQGWLTCICGKRVFVILKDSETYPCPDCGAALSFKQ